MLGVTTVDPEGDYVYLQVAAILRERIESGRYPQGRIMPSVRTLSEELEVSKGSVTHAVELLRSWKMVEGRVGRGTLVTPKSQWHLPADELGAPLYAHRIEGNLS